LILSENCEKLTESFRFQESDNNFCMLYYQEEASSRRLNSNQTGFPENDAHDGQKYVTKIGEWASQGRVDQTTWEFAFESE
jgi:hypothetical protein